MIKVDLNFKTEGGTDSEGNMVKANANISLASMLETTQLKDEVQISRYMSWARKLRTEGILECSEADILEIKKFILDSGAYSFFKDPVIAVLNETKK